MRWLVCLLLVAACDDTLPKPEKIADLRVLGIQLEPPEAPEGTTVRIQSLIVDPVGSFDTLWLLCVPPPGQIVPTGCASASGAQPIFGDSFAMPQAESLVTVVAAETAQGGPAACVQAIEKSGAAPDWCRIAFKRALVDPTQMNENPRISAAVRDGDVVSIALDPASVDEPLSSYFLSWFVSEGTLDSYRTDGTRLSNVWTADSGTLWVVVHDGRGGETWTTIDR